MELLYNSLIIATLFFFLLLLFRDSRCRSRAGNPGSKLPPGPTTLPIIGSIHHIIRSLPHRALRDLAATHGPLMHLRLGRIPFLVVSSPEAAREVMKTHDTIFATRPVSVAAKTMTYGGVDLIFSPYGEYWRQLRKLCVLELLSAKRVQSFRSIREEEVCNLVRSIGSMSSSSPVNISEILTSLTNTITTRATIGSKCKHQNRYLEVLKEVRMLLGELKLVDLFPGSMLVRLISRSGYKIERCHKEMDKILDAIVKEHKEMKKATTEINGGTAEEENLLDVLLRYQEHGGDLGFPITTNIIKAIIFDVFAAGTGTTSSTMAWVMSELIKNPRAMERAQEEVREVLGRRTDRPTEEDTSKLSYLKLVIKETLRLHPPAPLLLPRECTETCEVQGYTIPVKTRVIVNAWAIGQDPRYWKDNPEEFKPERFDGSQFDFKGTSFEYIPFGGGRRVCPGMLFGLASMELALAHLLYHFDWKLPNGLEPDDLDMTESFGTGIRRRSDLYLCATPALLNFRLP